MHTDDDYERTRQRLVARDEIRGIVAPEARRQGVATAILRWVARDGADHKGFIVYTYR